MPAQTPNNSSAAVLLPPGAACAQNVSAAKNSIIPPLHFQCSALVRFSVPPPAFFSGYHSISKTKSVLIGSRGLVEALCQRWWGSWLVQGHRCQQILVSVSGGLCLLVSPMNSFADGGWHGHVYQCGTKEGWGRCVGGRGNYEYVTAELLGPKLFFCGCTRRRVKEPVNVNLCLCLPPFLFAAAAENLKLWL